MIKKYYVPVLHVLLSRDGFVDCNRVEAIFARAGGSERRGDAGSPRVSQRGGRHYACIAFDQSQQVGGQGRETAKEEEEITSSRNFENN